MKKKWSVIGLSCALIATIFIAYSLEIRDSLPLDESGTQINVITIDDQIVSRAEFSNVKINGPIFYAGIGLLILGFLFQIIGIYKN